MCSRIIFSIVAVCVSAIALSSPKNQIPAKKLLQTPKIDGTVEPSEWQEATTFEGMVDKVSGQPAEESGKFWIAYDEKFIYFAAKLQDREPSKIEATEYRTNVSLGGDDFVELAIDPFNTYSSFNSFMINPRGATNIAIAGGRAAKREWLGEFVAKARITPEGWEAEARIPWEVMRLPSAGVKDLAFNVGRSHRRLQKGFVWGYTAGGRTENYGRWIGVQVPPVKSNSLKLLPYTYFGYDDGNILSNSGLDARIAITDQLEAVGSINPDFRNIENQILSIDFSYFERLAGESRPFFLEGSQFFSTSRDAPIFTSQRIQKFHAGLKVYGKITPNTDIGVISTTDFDQDNAIVARANVQLGTRKNLTAAVAELHRDNHSNTASFLSYSHSIDRITLFGQLVNTTDDTDGKGHRYNTGFVYGDGAINGSLEYIEISPDYRARLGFVPERGLKGVVGNLGINKPLKGSQVIEAGGDAWFESLKDFNGKHYRSSFGFATSTTFKDGTDLDLSYNTQDFLGHVDQTFDFSIEKPRGNPYRRWETGFTVGKIAGEKYQSERLSLSYRPFKPLQLNTYFQHVKFGQDDDSQFILSGVYDIGNDQSINGRLVNTSGDTNFYLAYRKSGNRGAEYFLIVGDPNARQFRTSVTLKVSVPFEIR